MTAVAELPTPARPIGVAVIGLGAISQSVHLPLLTRQADRFEIVALVDLSAERVADLAERYNVPEDGRLTGVAELAEKVASGELDVRAAILATTGSHAGDTLTLLKAGLTVLAEKPLAYSLAELDELEGWAAQNDVDLRERVRVGYMKEFDLATDAALAALEGTTLRAVEVCVLHPLDGAQLDFARLAAPPADVTAEQIAPLAAATDAVVDAAVGADLPSDLRRLYTGVVLGSIIHDLGVLRKLVGGVGEVRAAEHWGPGMPGSVHVRARLAEQPQVAVSIDWHYIDGYPDYRETVTLHHEGGTVELTFGVPYVTNLPTLLRVTERPTVPGHADAAGASLGIRDSESRWMQQEAFENELFALAALVAGEQAPGPSVAESRADIEVGQAIIAALAAEAGHSLASGSEAAAHPRGRLRPTV